MKMVRVSDEAHEALAKRAAANRRTLTAELAMILEELVAAQEGGDR